MLENPSKQLALVIVFILGSIASLYYKSIPLGNDLAGGTELIYSVDESKVDLTEGVTWDMFMDSMIGTIAQRVDPDGTINAGVVRRGRDGIYIGLPKVTDEEAKRIEDKITRLGTLQMQVCAYDDYKTKEKKTLFDLTKERDRLNVWLAKDGNKDKLKKDPLLIENYHATLTEKGGPLVGPDQLRWVPRKITAQIARPDQWDDQMSKWQNNELSNYIVPLFEDADLQKPPEEGQFLVEYLPINFDETGFSGKDLDANKVSPSVNPDNGQPVVVYSVKPEITGVYADLSEKYIGKQSSIILDGYVKSAPRYKSRIPGNGMIEGFTQPEAQALSDVLKRGSLEVKPEIQSRRTVGATLGTESIERGRFSLIIGTAFVLLFILFYYRIAGIVAMVGLILNIGFVFGAVSFIGATLTLPGLGGLVLTVGMAIDANILIYERIREEMKSGKDLLQAVRHGFERAMVTILDANVTTFIAGLVLYNFGVGPIRGFAVTLMVGIVTSLFTAFFVSRLLFHFLLERKLEKLPMAEWFQGFRFNFLSMSKPALALSSVIIVGGMAVFFTTPAQTRNGLEFTGGAVINVVTKVAMTPNELRDKLTTPVAGKQTAFVESLGGKIDPVVNSFATGGDEISADGKAKHFSIKVKVDPELAGRIEAARKAAKDEGKVYREPYVAAVATTLADILVPQAYSNARLTPKGDDRSQYADLQVHYAQKVKVEDIKKTLTEALGDSSSEVAVTAMINGKADATATEASDLRLEFDVGKTVTTDAKLIAFTAERLKNAGVKLSNPIPDVATLGGQIVGELQSAAIGAMILALFFIVMYIRVRFREFKYGFGAVAALAHDVLVALGIVVLFNRMGWVNCELSLSLIAAFLTIIGYSINDTIVIFDRIRENIAKQHRAGETDRSFADTVNLSINQTLGRTILTSFTTLFVVGALFIVNYGAGSELEGFAFAMIIGVVTGTYSTIFVASPIVMYLRSKEKPDQGLSEDGGLGELGPIEGPAEEEGQMPAVSNP